MQGDEQANKRIKQENVFKQICPVFIGLLMIL